MVRAFLLPLAMAATVGVVTTGSICRTMDHNAGAVDPLSRCFGTAHETETNKLGPIAK